jgi:capsular polysaccharide biosynthesis protein
MMNVSYMGRYDRIARAWQSLGQGPAPTVTPPVTPAPADEIPSMGTLTAALAVAAIAIAMMVVSGVTADGD